MELDLQLSPFVFRLVRARYIVEWHRKDGCVSYGKLLFSRLEFFPPSSITFFLFFFVFASTLFQPSRALLARAQDRRGNSPACIYKAFPKSTKGEDNIRSPCIYTRERQNLSRLKPLYIFFFFLFYTLPKLIRSRRVCADEWQQCFDRYASSAKSYWG